MHELLDSIKREYCNREPFVSANVVAKHLGLNVWTVYKLAQRSKIKSHKFGKSRRFKLSEVETVPG